MRCRREQDPARRYGARHVGAQHASVRLSVGIAMYPHARTPGTLMQCAETALLEA
jgi:hypothetical protein